jgi:hypothetical protein
MDLPRQRLNRVCRCGHRELAHLEDVQRRRWQCTEDDGRASCGCKEFRYSEPLTDLYGLMVELPPEGPRWPTS